MSNSLKLDTENAKRLVGTINQDLENLVSILNHLDNNNYDANVYFHREAESADQSAQETGIDQSRIAKTLVFNADGLVAVLAPGDSKIDEEKLEEAEGSEVSLADPERVEEETGFKVGGVAPFDLDMKLYVEKSLLEHDKVKPSGGSSVMSVEVDPSNIVEKEGAESRSLI